MVRKDGELGGIDDESLARVKLIAEKKRQLERTADQVHQEISSCFERLFDKLRARERQLQRQVEAVHRQQLALVQSNSELLPANASLGIDLNTEAELLAVIQDFGRVDLSNSMALKDFEPYRAEEYQEDVVSFDKSLKSETEELDALVRSKRDNNADKPVVINFSCPSCDVSVETADKDAATAVALAPAVASTSRQLDESQGAAAANMSGNYSPFAENDSDSDESSVEEVDSPVRGEHSSSFFVGEDEHKTIEHSSPGDGGVVTSPIEDNACGVAEVQDKSKEGLADEHPIQIQQWLRQILAETETEPIVNETGRPIVVGQFPKLPSNSRLYHEFPVET
ncbi:uncharacterized protein LOC106644095 [Copidosoma floridanum]|uniref:uncharacterized protein LOC106644095 n=1 Tax=Copidosoma floridanum TaxID=29053 RepID=UPI0006C9D033|nr:uncharacterized protein LOC106644095 [Copidosoma floridanum]